MDLVLTTGIVWLRKFQLLYCCACDVCVLLPERSFTVELWARGRALADSDTLQQPAGQLLSYATRQASNGERMHAHMQGVGSHTCTCI